MKNQARIKIEINFIKTEKVNILILHLFNRKKFQ